ncbi:MAG: DUF3833 domain-containing protein [Bdellovibrio sp.]|nr:DUF3833 domain-containing protein [Bdellovibrio sp.]
MKTILGLLFLAFLSACSTSIKSYEGQKPPLLLESYFNGKMKAHGLVMNRADEVTRRFVVSLDTSWKNNVGTLREDFEWSDGEKTQRIWTIKKIADGKYEGTASDIDGIAIGESAGNAFHWTYKMDLKTKDSSFYVKFQDWMYLVDEKTLINEAKIYWYGIYGGKVLISFQK